MLCLHSALCIHACRALSSLASDAGALTICSSSCTWQAIQVGTDIFDSTSQDCCISLMPFSCRVMALVGELRGLSGQEQSFAIVRLLVHLCGAQPPAQSITPPDARQQQAGVSAPILCACLCLLRASQYPQSPMHLCCCSMILRSVLTHTTSLGVSCSEMCCFCMIWSCISSPCLTAI